MKIIGIYCIVNRTNNKKYVGSSIDIKNRFRQHRHNLKHNKHCNSHLQAAWNKYGEDQFNFEIIEELDTSEEILEVENFWIEYHSALTDGYNQRIEAHSNIGIKRSEEFKEACRQRWLGHTQSPQQIEKRMETMRRKKESGEYSHGGWKLTEEQLKARKEKGRTKIYQYTLEGELVAVFHAINKAAEVTGFNSSGISNCARGHRKTYRGFKWTYTPIEE